MSVDLTEETFDDMVGKTNGVVVVQFTAPWCGPCKMLAPRLQELEDEGTFTYFKVNVDDNSELARNFRIMSVPTILIYKDGELANQWVGVKSKQDILAKVNEVL